MILACSPGPVFLPFYANLSSAGKPGLKQYWITVPFGPYASRYLTLRAGNATNFHSSSWPRIISLESVPGVGQVNGKKRSPILDVQLAGAAT